MTAKIVQFKVRLVLESKPVEIAVAFECAWGKGVYK